MKAKITTRKVLATIFFGATAASMVINAGKPGQVVGRGHYGVDFAAALAEGSRFAVQFHPEKSHTHGLQLLQNFIAWDGRW